MSYILICYINKYNQSDKDVLLTIKDITERHQSLSTNTSYINYNYHCIPIYDGYSLIGCHLHLNIDKSYNLDAISLNYNIPFILYTIQENTKVLYDKAAKYSIPITEFISKYLNI